MKDELIKYETATLAKEKGFSLKVYNYFQIGAISRGVEEHSTRYINDINTTFKESAMFSRPTQGLLQRWLREVHNINVASVFNEDLYRRLHTQARGKKCLNYHWKIITNIKDEEHFFETFHSEDTFEIYEEALEAGLQQALKLI